MSRSALVLLLSTSLAATVYLALQLAGGDGTDGRREHERRESDAPAPERVRVPDGPAPGPAPEPAAPVVSGRVSGFVRETGGRPLPAAVVRGVLPAGVVEAGAPRVAVADSDGRYELELAPGWVLEAFAPGHLPVIGLVNGQSNGRTELRGPGPWTLDFTLEPAASLAGRVLDAGTGAPVRGAVVYLVSPEHVMLDRRHAGNTARTDERGAYRFDGAQEGVIDLGAKAEGYLPALERDVAIPARGALVRDLLVSRGRRVHVEVVDPGASTLVIAADSRLRRMQLPPGGVAALASGLPGREFVHFPALAVEPWSFEEDVMTGKTRSAVELAGLPPGPVDISAHAADRITEPGLGSVLDSVAERVELTLLARRLVRFRAVDALTREPIAVRITRRAAGAGAEFEVVADGDALPLPADDRRHLLRFFADGYEAAGVEVLPDFSGPLEIALEPVAEGATGSFGVLFEPLLTGRLALVGRDAEGRTAFVRHLEKSDDDGRWIAKKVPVGEYAVSVLATGMVPALIPRVLVARERTEVYRVALSEGGGLAFKVAGPDGTLLDKVWLDLRDAGDNRIDIHLWTQISDGRAFLSVNYLPSAATAKADSGLAPGSYTLHALREGYQPGAAAFSIRGTETAEATVTLRPR